MTSAWFTSMPKRLFGSFTLALLSMCCLTCWSQTITGSITGKIPDPSGAVVQNATVSAKNVDTGVVVPTVTNKDGIYSIRFLQIGRIGKWRYQNGLQSQGLSSVQSEPDSTTRWTGSVMRSVTETTQVQGSLPPLLDTEDATTSTTFDANTIENITNKGRNFSLFTALIPGAVDTSPQQLSGNFATERDTAQVSEIGVNGNRAQGNSYVLDGVEINETIGNLIGYNPNLDALGEVEGGFGQSFRASTATRMEARCWP